jgi:limonene-1,2-epoxide hydrolase
MRSAISIVNEFLELTNIKHDIGAAVSLMADDIHFVGPVMAVRGAQEYRSILERFLPVHAGWRKLAELESVKNVCVIDEIDIEPPSGKRFTMKLSEWFEVREGRIVTHAIYYDPREFMRAFMMT